jgi:serine/threonine-protein kinase
MNVTPAVRLLRPLGQGGMGKVWVAEHTGLKTEVVVKLLSTDVTDKVDAAARFSREASVAAAVKSPHVVQVFDYGVTPEGQPYIVMELLEGRDLADHLAKRGKMTPRDVAALVSQIAKGLGKAHQVGVIHRDIKPENIFLCDGEGGEMFVKLLDFGIAKNHMQIQSSATTTGQVVGTPYYMSPEQIVGEKDLDARTDIWSLGVVAFEALTGKRPFEGSTIGAITLSLHTARPKMTAIAPELPAALDDWFSKACAREPGARFATAREAAQALSEAAGEVVAGPPLLRAPMESLPNLDELAPPADSGPKRSDRAVTNLSSSYGVHAPVRKKPPAFVLAGAVAVVVVLMVVVAVAVFRKPKADDPPVTAAPPPPTTVASAPASAAPPAPPTDTARPPDPAASASSTPGVTAAIPTTTKPGTLKRTPGATTARPKGTTKKSNDDDIK